LLGFGFKSTGKALGKGPLNTGVVRRGEGGSDVQRLYGTGEGGKYCKQFTKKCPPRAKKRQMHAKEKKVSLERRTGIRKIVKAR
jgi:hypothetical protein